MGKNTARQKKWGVRENYVLVFNGHINEYE